MGTKPTISEMHRRIEWLKDHTHLTAEQAAKKLDIKKSAVLDTCRKYKIKITTPIHHLASNPDAIWYKFTPKQKAEQLANWGGKYVLADLCKEFGCSVSSMSKYCKKNGIKLTDTRFREHRREYREPVVEAEKGYSHTKAQALSAQWV